MTLASTNCCPTCGRAYPKAKAPAALSDTMSTAERYAYFKKIAPLENARFIFRCGATLSPELEADWRAHVARIEAGTAGTPSQIEKTTAALQQRHRVEMFNRECPPKPGWMYGATPITVDWSRLHHRTRHDVHDGTTL